MSDEAQAQPTMGNSTEARSPTGEIKDQQATTETGKQAEQTATSQAATTTQADTTTDKKPTTTPVVPDRYDFKVPDGATLDPKLVETVSPIFKELGLTAEQGQRLFDLHTQLNADAKTALETTMTTMRTEWREQVNKDTSLSDGKGDLSPAAKKDISNAITALGPAAADFKAAMDLTGAGDHHAVVSALRTIGKLLGEGTAVRGNGASPLGQAGPNSRPASAAAALFPNLPSSSRQ